MIVEAENSCWRAYLINLDRSPHRLAMMQERLEQAGVPWERVAGIDGQALAPADRVGIDTHGFLLSHGRYIEPGDIGCYLSHIKALQAFLASDDPFGVILEDDVAFAPDFMSLMTALLVKADSWDVVKLSGRHSGTPIPLLKLSETHRLVALTTRHTGAGAYLVNRLAAQRYIEKLLPMRVPYDHSFDRAWHFGFRFRAAMPLPVQAQASGESTITEGIKFRKPNKYKVPKLLHRTENELRRFFHYLSRGLIIPRCSWPPKNDGL
jgi:glycosyl transferase family 25